MIVTLFPAFSHEAYAAELPDSTQFATVDELKSFNTNDNDGTKNPAKVYFGNNDQQWWIAGSQNGNLTLFAASPLQTGVGFNSSTSDGEYDGQTVNANHYGASDIKKKVKEFETSYFSNKEQALMNDTTIYTNNTKNGSTYSTTDKLYLAYGDLYDDQYITVGTNSKDNLNDGLRVDKDYLGNSGRFWLRAPNMSVSYSALVAGPGAGVQISYVVDDRALEPAFELNLSSVIFASAAPAASSTGDLTLQDTDGDGAFTLRYSGKDLGSALVSYDKSRVTLTGVPNGTYLVVQNSAGAKAEQITNETEISASDMELDSFANCKVWLETTETTNRMTYATLAEEKGTAVNITASTGLNITSNNGAQEVAPNTAIADITVEVADGYYLPDGYKDTIQGLNGLTVTETDNGFTISGTPTSDVNVTLPAATVLPKADTPVAINHVPTINASDKTITVGDKFDPMKDVTANDNEDGDLTSKIKVIHNTVDTKKAGTYEVTYQVTDSQGATVTKTLKVAVKAAPVNPDKDKPDNDKNDGSVETGDRTNLLLWEVMLIGSSIIMLYSLYRKKRKTNQ